MREPLIHLGNAEKIEPAKDVANAIVFLYVSVWVDSIWEVKGNKYNSSMDK